MNPTILQPSDATNRLPSGGRALSRRVALGMILGLIGSGCAETAYNRRIALPSSHNLQAEQLQLFSEIKIEKDHPVITDLQRLRQQISETLELPLGSKPVVVYLFSNEQEYNQYLDTKFPGFPKRRAYFIETAGRDLSVYTWWGEQIQEDLRHEYTHGLLHACLTNVPLWLDEGLAEYFEVGGGVPGLINNEHAQLLANDVQRGAWRPDLARLEYLEEVKDMARADYREAWAWVHFMMHSSPETRAVLLEYLHDLQTNPRPGSLRDRLLAVTPQLDQRLVVYVASMNGPAHWGGSFPNPGRPTIRAANR